MTKYLLLVQDMAKYHDRIIKKNVGFDIVFILPQHKTTMRSDVGTK